MGDWSPETINMGAARPCLRPGGGPLAALSVLPRVPARRRASSARRAGGLGGRAQVGRHTRPAHPARRRASPLVARRRADDRPLSRAGRGSSTSCRTAPCSTARCWPGRRTAPLPFAALQKRIGRKTVPKKLLAEAPVVLRAYDLLEWEGADMRDAPLRRPARTPRGARRQACPPNGPHPPFAAAPLRRHGTTSPRSAPAPATKAPRG